MIQNILEIALNIDMEIRILDDREIVKFRRGDREN